MRSITALAAGLILSGGSLLAQSPTLVTGPRTMVPAIVNCTDLPAAALPAPLIFVRGGHNVDGHQNLTRGEVAVLTRAPEDGLAVGQRYAARRLLGGAARFPAKGEGFGKIRTAGWLTVTAVDDVNALATIDFACDGIEPGDYLEPFVDAVLPTAADPLGEPQFEVRANILFGVDGRESFGDGDVLSIDRGVTHGVATGARFAMYRDRKDGMPLVHLGEAVVLEVAELTSKVVMVRVKDIIEVGDIAVPRRTR